jgi:hypothetical protein
MLTLTVSRRKLNPSISSHQSYCAKARFCRKQDSGEHGLIAPRLTLMAESNAN